MLKYFLSLAKAFCVAALVAWAFAEVSNAQFRPPGRPGSRGGPGMRGGPGGHRGGPPNPARDPSSTVSPVAVGEAGIAWYSTWEVASKEAIRSNRPILFMAAASQCSGVPGVF